MVAILSDLRSQPADGGGPLGGKAFFAVATTIVAAIPIVVFGLAGPGDTGPPSREIPGSVAAPAASEVSPICDAPDPSGVLGPESSLPSNPTTTVVTPSGGVSSFAATSSNLYVNTGSALDTYSLTGSLVRSFSLPGAFASSKEPSQPVVDPSGDIYLSSNYGQIVDKFSPTGSLLWSVDPRNGSPEGLFGITNGSGFELAVSLVQNTSSSDLLDLSTGAVNGSFPLVDDGYVTEESDGNLLYSQGGYVETVSPSGAVLSTFGSSATQQNGAHTGAGIEFSTGGQAVQGPDGTIYTSDPKDTFEATSPSGDLLATTTFGGNLQVGSGGFYLVGSTLYFQGGPVYNDAGDNISSIPLSTLQADLSAVHRPYDTLGWGAGLTTGATGNYFAAGTTPSVDATFDPWWSGQASHLQLPVLGREHRLARRRDACPAGTTLSLPTNAVVARVDPAHTARLRRGARPLPGAGLALRHLDLAPDPPRHHLHALHGRRAPATASTSPPCRAASAAAGRATRGESPSTRSSASTVSAAPASTGPPSSPTARRPPRPPRPVRRPRWTSATPRPTTTRRPPPRSPTT